MSTEYEQFQQYQESLPTVNRLVYDMLINELIPICMLSEKDRAASDESDGEIANEERGIDGPKPSEDVKDGNGSKTNGGGSEELSEKFVNISINDENWGSLERQSHKLIEELSQTSDKKVHHSSLKMIYDVGFTVGEKLSELLIFRNNPNLQFKDMDLLLVMKFICRDVWKQVFGKQIDNLKTNHRGTFYLIDYDYRPIQNFSIDGDDPAKELQLVEPFLQFPIGIVKGVLASLGYLPDTVSCAANFIDRPQKEVSPEQFQKMVSFHVQIIPVQRKN